MQGIKRYNIFRYFEDVNMLLPVATEFDMENNTLYAETDELGTYCVLDMEVLLQNFGIAPDGMQTAAVEKKLYSGSGAGYNVTFIIDTRKGLITEDELQRIKDELCTFMAHSLSNGYELGVTLYTQNSTNFADESCEYVGYYKTTEALEAALDGISLTDRYGEEYVGYTYCEITEGIEKASIGSQGTNDYVFSVFAQDGTLFDVEKYNQIYKNASMTGVNISFITDKYGLNTAQTRLPDITGGIVVNNISTFADDVYNHIFEEPLVEVETFSAILATGYQQVELKGVLNAYNGYDTDEDTLTDWKEVDVEHWLEVGLITYNDDNTIKLPTVEQCMRHVEKPYVESAFARFYNMPTTEYIASISAKEVMPISSDPTNDDTDGDSYVDEQDLDCLIPFKNPIIFIHGRVSNSADTFGLETKSCVFTDKDENHDGKPDVISYNNNFGLDCDEQGYSYESIETQLIVSILKNTMGSFYASHGYTVNKNMFVFNYANQDFACKNGPMLEAYINNIKKAVSEPAVYIKNFNATSSDIFATKDDLNKNHARFILIGHSNGGLVSRYYIENLGGDVNVDKLITIDTPHYGSDVYKMPEISSVLLATGNTMNNLAVPLDVELRTDSRLFTGEALDINSMTFVETRNYISDYISHNQTPKLNGNSSVTTEYYAICGAWWEQETGYKPVGEVFCYTDISNIATEKDFIRKISDDFWAKYPEQAVFIDAYTSDNVVRVSSQLGIVFNFGLFGSGSVKERVSFNGSAVFGTDDPKYGMGIIGLSIGVMYHVGILENKDMYSTVMEFIG